MTLSPRLKWKINRYGRKLSERWEGARDFVDSLWRQQRMCPACRALVDRRERSCPFCKERMSRFSGSALDRLISSFVPDQARYTFLLLSINMLLFLMTFIASSRVAGGFDTRGLLGSVDGFTLLQFGAKWGFLISAGEWWRFVTPIFLHGSLLHIAFNSWVLYDLGPAVEGLYGRQRFLVLYVLSGIVGVLASWLWRPNSLSVGASGALLGLIGAMITYGYRNRRSVADPVRNMFVRWAVYVLILGLIIPQIDNAAHIGGLLAGLVFGLVVSDLPSLTSGSILFWKILQTAVILLVVVSFGMLVLHPVS